MAHLEVVSRQLKTHNEGTENEYQVVEREFKNLDEGTHQTKEFTKEQLNGLLDNLKNGEPSRKYSEEYLTEAKEVINDDLALFT